MSDRAIRPPARQLDEFEELVYEYTTRMGLGNEEVRPYLTQRRTLHSNPSANTNTRLNSTGMSTRAIATSASNPQRAGHPPKSPSSSPSARHSVTTWETYMGDAQRP